MNLQHIVYSLVGIIIGFLLVWKVVFVVNLTGANSWGEKIFGPGGTYTFYKMIGSLIIIISILYLFGFTDVFLNWLGHIIRSFIGLQ